MQVLVLTTLFFAVALVCAFVAVFIGLKVLERRNGVMPESQVQIIKEDKVSSFSVIASLLSKFDFINVLRTRTEQAGLNWSAGRVGAAMLLTGAVSLVFLHSLSRIPWVFAIPISLGCALLPYTYILQRRQKRLHEFELQFPDALEAIIRGLRAGHPFATSMEMLANEDMGPVTIEIRRTIEEWRLGMTWNQALDNLANRLPTTDVGIFVAAVKLQMRTGGRLSEVLLKLAESMRENVALRGEVRALAAQARLTGTVLTVLPIVLAILLFFVNPNQMMLLLEDPGRTFTLSCACMLVLAHFVIRRIVDIQM